MPSHIHEYDLTCLVNACSLSYTKITTHFRLYTAARLAIYTFDVPFNPGSAAILTRGRGSACACTADKMAEKKKAVSFTASELSEGKSKKQPPTQKYDRKEIQKRLDIENWMDEELKRIYAVEVNPLRLRAGYLSTSFFDIAQPLSSFNSCSHVLPVSRCSLYIPPVL